MSPPAPGAARAAAPPGLPPAASGAARRATRGAIRPVRDVEPVAPELPVARIALDLPLAHLDRPFDYLVGASQPAVPGARVRVRFAGQDVGGYVLERVPVSGFAGRLARVSRVVSPEPALSSEIAALARLVADRWAGTMADVLRLAVPPRHAGVEKEAPSCRVPRRPPARTDSAPRWHRYQGGGAFLGALARGAAPRAAWTALPGEDWPAALAAAAAATLAGGRGALLVAPDVRDVARVDAALLAELGPGRHVALTSELGPSERYRRWLAVRRGQVRVVVGTRAATYAPVDGLGLVATWDDGDDLLAEPRAPYPHPRDVLTLRAHESGAAALLGGFARSTEVAALVASGWAVPVGAPRPAVRRSGPRIEVAAGDAERDRDPAAASARLPSLAWRTARAALTAGPVLVQVPRGGYLPRLSCARCRAPARCDACSGPLALSAGTALPTCQWCARPAATHRCPVCDGVRLRADAVGSRRTAEELGRAFPGVPLRISAGQRPVGPAEAAPGSPQPIEHVGAEPALVVATPGAEPVAAGGYAAALLLDGGLLLGRPDLRAGEEALRRWLNAAALVRPGPDGGVVVVMADPGAAAVQALVRWDPAGSSDRELADRRAAVLPPAVRVAQLRGPAPAVADLLAATDLPDPHTVLGPVPEPASGTQHGDAPQSVRTLIRVPRARGAQLAAALQTGQRSRSARKAAEHVRVQIDPLDLG